MAGRFVPELTVMSAGGLALVMALGLITRIRLRDSLLQLLPASVLLVVNASIAWYAVGRGAV